MTADLKTQIRDFAQEFAADLPSVDIETIVSDSETDQIISPVTASKRWWPTWAPAVLAAFLVIIP